MISASLHSVLSEIKEIEDSLTIRSRGLDQSGHIREDLTPFNDNEDFLADKITELSRIVARLAERVIE